VDETTQYHPFEERNVHPDLPDLVRHLFDDGHFAQATFEAFKYVDKVVQKHADSTEIGTKLMGKAFGETGAVVLTRRQTSSDTSEEKGYYHLFAGGVLAIRNPRGHEHSIQDSPDNCLDHLAFASMLLRRLEDAGFRVDGC